MGLSSPQSVIASTSFMIERAIFGDLLVKGGYPTPPCLDVVTFPLTCDPPCPRSRKWLTHTIPTPWQDLCPLNCEKEAARLYQDNFTSSMNNIHQIEKLIVLMDMATQSEDQRSPFTPLEQLTFWRRHQKLLDGRLCLEQLHKVPIPR